LLRLHDAAEQEASMSDSLYERDALAWAERQAELLRRLAAGERMNEAVDWPNVIEEVRDVGLSELRACQSLLRQAMVHLIDLHAWPDSQAVTHWYDEAGVFLDDAADRFAPSMRQRIDLGELYAKARRRAQAARETSGSPRPLPEACPFTLDELLAGDVAALLAKLGSLIE
jgi:hypothetical protein